MLKLQKGGIRKKVFIGIFCCIIGPYLLIISFGTYYFEHKSTILRQSFYFDKPLKILSIEESYIQILQSPSWSELFTDLAVVCKDSPSCQGQFESILNKKQNIKLSWLLSHSNQLLFEANLSAKPQWLVGAGSSDTKVFEDWIAHNWSKGSSIQAKTFFLEGSSRQWLVQFTPLKIQGSEGKYRGLLVCFDLLAILNSVIADENVLLLRPSKTDDHFKTQQIQSWNLLNKGHRVIERVDKSLIFNRIRDVLIDRRQIFLSTENSKDELFYSWVCRSGAIPEAVYFSIKSEFSVRESLNKVLVYIVFFSLLLFIYLILIVYFFVYRVANPIQELSIAVDNFSENFKESETTLFFDISPNEYLEVNVLKQRFGNTAQRLSKQFHLMQILLQISKFITSLPTKEEFFEYMRQIYSKEFNLTLKNFDSTKSISFEEANAYVSEESQPQDLLKNLKEMRIHDEFKVQLLHAQTLTYLSKLSLELQLQKNIAQQKEFELAESINKPFNRIQLPANLEWGHNYLPARYFGGDFVDAQKVNNGFEFLIGDVAGKGVGSSLVSVRMRVGFQVLSSTSLSLQSKITQLNDILFRKTLDGVFCTIFMARYNAEIKQLTFVSGGHNRMIVINPEGEFKWLSAKGLPLGIFEQVDFECGICDIEVGSLLFLYTDGCTEAENREFELYGEKRLTRLLSKHHKQPVKNIVDRLIGDIEKFSAGREQSDDITFFLARLV